MIEIESLKNIAVVAHVDHGKTTLIDCLLNASGAYGERDQVVERVMDSGELEKEKGITIRAKNCSIYWNDKKINLLDTPGHADFGGEVERSLMMVDSIVLLVDASEGPLPQTRFVLQKALERRLKIAVLINKIDRPDERIEEVKNETEDLLLDIIDVLGLDDYDLEIPFMYASAKDGWATKDPSVKTDNMNDLMDFLASDYFPAPKVAEGEGLQLLVCNLTYSTYLGAQVIGRIERGSVAKNQQVFKMGKDKKVQFKVTNLQTYEKLGQVEVEKVSAGEIVILAGLTEGDIGDTISSIEYPEALERIEVEPPTVSVFCSVNTSPIAGREGEYLTSRKLEEFLEESCKNNVALKYVTTDDAKVCQLKGRGELQLALIFEELRRKGFEFMLSRPEVLTKDVDGQLHEPFENLILDIPNDCTGAVTEKLSKRKGIMNSLVPMGETRSRMEFKIPSRGIIGYRSQFLTDTRGEGIFSSEFLGYEPFAGKITSRINGSIISDRAGKMTPYALFNLLSNGKFFVEPGETTYEGQVIGEHSKKNDTNVNAVREKHLAAMRTAGKDVNISLPPIAPKSIEWALDWIDDDEWVEITPESIRIRKKELGVHKRSVIRG